MICFESSNSPSATSLVNNGANLLINITNDAWFGPTQFPRQHAQFSPFRAIENRVPVIRVTNTGLTCAISSRGFNYHSLPLGKKGLISVSISIKESPPPTLVKNLGQWFGGLCCLLSILGILFFRLKRK